MKNVQCIFFTFKFVYLQMNIIVDHASVYNSYLNVENRKLDLRDVIYVGGIPPMKRLPRLPLASNFVGCLKEVRKKLRLKFLQCNYTACKRLKLSSFIVIIIQNYIVLKFKNKEGRIIKANLS